MIRLGIIGCGAIAAHHLKALVAQQDVQPVAFCNRTRSKAEAMAAPYPNAKIYSDHRQLLKDGGFDALGVFVNVDQIMPVTLDCLDAKLPLLVEKPIGQDPGESRKLVEKAKKTGSPVMVALNRRFIGPIAKAKAVMAEHGGFSALLVKGHERFDFVKSLNRYSDAQLERWIYLNSIHVIDLLRFFGGDVKSVISMSRHKDRHYHAAISFADGRAGFYEATFNCPEGWAVELFSPKVKATLKPLEKLTLNFPDNKVEEIELDAIDKDYKPGFFLQGKAFVEGVKTGRFPAPAADLEDAFKSVELAEKIVGQKL